MEFKTLQVGPGSVFREVPLVWGEIQYGADGLKIDATDARAGICGCCGAKAATDAKAMDGNCTGITVGINVKKKDLVPQKNYTFEDFKLPDGNVLTFQLSALGDKDTKLL